MRASAAILGAARSRSLGEGGELLCSPPPAAPHGARRASVRSAIEVAPRRLRRLRPRVALSRRAPARRGRAGCAQRRAARWRAHWRAAKEGEPSRHTGRIPALDSTPATAKAAAAAARRRAVPALPPRLWGWTRRWQSWRRCVSCSATLPRQLALLLACRRRRWRLAVALLGERDTQPSSAGLAADEVADPAGGVRFFGDRLPHSHSPPRPSAAARWRRSHACKRPWRRRREELRQAWTSASTASSACCARRVRELKLFSAPTRLFEVLHAGRAAASRHDRVRPGRRRRRPRT